MQGKKNADWRLEYHAETKLAECESASKSVNRDSYFTRHVDLLIDLLHLNKDGGGS